jgi:Fe-S cluster biogenesis protein NfuA
VTTPTGGPAIGPTVDPTTAGDRIERLLEAMSAAGPVARERAEELVRIVVELYGAGLERLLDLAYDNGALDDTLLTAFASDPLVSALLLVHGLHPESLEARVRGALDDVRPALESHGGDAEFLELDAEGSVRLRLVAGGQGCGSSPAALAAAVEDAVRAAAPEIEAVELVVDDPEPALIPVGSLTARLREAPPADERG